MSYPERPLRDALALAKTSEQTSVNKKYKIAGIYSFGRGLIKRPEISGSETAYNSLHRISTGQIVMSKLNAWEGAIALVSENFDGSYVSPEYPVYDADESNNDLRYLRHLISWPWLWTQLTPRGSMVRRKRTTPETFLSTRAPLPDLAEQRRVGARLDLAMAKAERIVSLSQSTALLREGLIEALFREHSTEPRHSMGNLADLERIPAELHEDQEYVAIGIRSFGRGIFHRAAVRPIELGKLNYFKIVPGRLIVSNIMAWEGAIALSTAEDDGCIGSHRFLSYVPRRGISASYLNYFFQTKEGKLSIVGASTGTVKRNQTLSIRDFESIEVPIPGTREQERVVRILDTALLHVGELTQRRQKELAAMRLALQNAAFTGQL